LICHFLKLFFECILFFELLTSEWHGYARKDLISRTSKSLSDLHWVSILNVLGFSLSQVLLGLGLIKQVGQLDDFLAFAGLGRFTFRSLVELLEELLFDAVAILAILEGVKVGKDELIESGQVVDVAEILIDCAGGYSRL